MGIMSSLASGKSQTLRPFETQPNGHGVGRSGKGGAWRPLSLHSPYLLSLSFLFLSTPLSSPLSFTLSTPSFPPPPPYSSPSCSPYFTFIPPPPKSPSPKPLPPLHTTSLFPFLSPTSPPPVTPPLSPSFLLPSSNIVFTPETFYTLAELRFYRG